ncbi:MAG: YncE family protein, partial [Candidatus Sericytochromatia bacterium]
SSIIYHPDLEFQKYLGLSKTFLYGSITHRQTTFLPYELYLSPDNSLLCISNREEGKVYLFNTQLREFEGEIHVRDHAASNKAINITFSTIENIIYITDNMTPNLAIYEIGAKRYSKRTIGEYPLSNIVISPYEDSVYIISKEEEPVLKHISLERYDVIKDFTLKGKLFSDSDYPCDLMTFSPDNKNIYLVTYLDDPEPFTPVITVIDFDKNKAIKRFSIKDGTKPVNLVFSEENKLYNAFKNINDLALENNWISNEVYEKVKLESEEDLKLLESNLEMSDDEVEFLDINPEPYLLEATIKDDQQELNIKPTRQKHIIISPEADKYIIELIVGIFWEKTSIDLTEVREMQAIMRNMARITRKNLEFYDIDVIKKESFYQNNPIALIVQRTYILEMLAEEEAKVRKEASICPTNCTNCKSPMMGSWVCQACGIELEKPENILRRKEASLINTSNLQTNHFWGINYEKAVLYEFDRYNVCVSTIDKDKSIIESIDNFYRLETGNTIIFDKTKQNILEISSRGRVVRKYATKSKETTLIDTNFVTTLNDRNLLIASQGKIFETNFFGKLIWEYKTDLINPISIQKTYDSTYLVVDEGKNKVIEIEKTVSDSKTNYNFVVIWEYQKDNISPYYAYKDPDSNYTILDSKNSRVILLDQNSKIKWEFSTLLCGIENPIGVIKLKNQDIVIYNKSRISCIMPLEQNKIKFTYNIEDLSKRDYLYLISNDQSDTFKAAEAAKKKNTKINSLKESEELLSKLMNKEDVDNIKKGIKKSSTSNKNEQKTIIEDEPNKEIKIEEKPKVKQISKKFSIEEIRELMKNKDKETSSDKDILEENHTGEYDPSKSRIVITPGANVIPISLPIVDSINNKVFIINRSGDIIWEFKDDNIKNINDVIMTPDRSVIISSSSGLFEVDIKSKRITFKYSHPCSGSSKLRNGNYLICDNSKQTVIEIDRAENNIWSYYHEKEEPSSAMRLPNGNTLIIYSKVNCIKEVNNQS